MAALSQEGAKYSDFMSYLQDEFQNNNIQFVINRKFPKDSTDMSMVGCLSIHLKDSPNSYFSFSIWEISKKEEPKS